MTEGWGRDEMLEMLRRTLLGGSRVEEPSDNPADYPRWTEVTDRQVLDEIARLEARAADGATRAAEAREIVAEVDVIKRRVYRMLATAYPYIADASPETGYRVFEGRTYYVGMDR